MTPIVRHFGEFIPLWKLIRHYRLMARMNPKSAGFWRTLTRTTISQYREQAAQFERLAA